MGKMDMSELFKDMQNQMLARLELGRKNITHSGEMGEAAENSWREWLEYYLPNRYKVDKAFVIDCNGETSDQIDIVIYDRQYSYFVFRHEQVIYVPAESVYAVIEIKQELNKENLLYAGNKAKSVRKLERTSVDIPFAAGIYRAKPLHEILAGIIALESTWADPIGKTLENNMKKLDKESRIDFGCILKQGSFWADYSNELKLQRSSKDEALLFFFLKVLMNLQCIGTVPAIDIGKYAEPLESF